MNRFYKFTVALGLSVVLLFSTTNLSHGAQSDWGDYIKVGLKSGANAEREYLIKSPEGFLLGWASDRGFEEGMPLPAYDTIRVKLEGGSIVLEDQDGTLLSTDLGSSGVIMPGNYLDGGIISLNNISYRGGLMFFANTNGTLTAINYIPLEHYIYGVLNGELHYTNPKEALKAQAVAARSFAALSIDKHKASGFDVCPSTHCQVYKGYSDEFGPTKAATDETKGQKLYYNGKTVTGFYFKNSAGHTQNVENVWSGSQGYLIGVEDPYSPSYPWTATVSFLSLQQRLEAAGYNPGAIKSVSVKSTIKPGRVMDLEIVGTNGTVNLKKETIRNVLGATLIKSTMFTIDGDVGGPRGSVMVHNGQTTSGANSEVYILGSGGNLIKKDLSETYARNTQSTMGLRSGTGAGAPAGEAAMGDKVVFKGYGYGHGVGMPQDSAIAMAKQGFSYTDILKKYYTDIEIR